MNAGKFLLTLLFLSSFFGGTAHAQESQKYIDSALKELNSGKYQGEKKAGLINHLANAYAFVDPDEGIKYSLEGLKLCKEIGFKKGVENCYRSLALSFETKAEFLKALDAFGDAQKIAEEIGSKKDIGDIIMEVGTIQFYQNNYPEAIRSYFKASKIYEELGYKKGMANTNMGLGTIYQAQEMYDKSIGYLLKALKMYEEMGDKQGIGIVNGNLGATYSKMNENEKALPHLLKDMQIEEELGNTADLGVAVQMTGETYYRLKDYPHAIEYAQRSFKINSQLGNKRSQAEALALVAFCGLNEVKQRVEAGNGNLSAQDRMTLSKASDNFQKSLAIGNEIKVEALIEQSYEGLSAISDLRHDYKTSLDYYRKYTALRDTVFSEENKLKLTRLESARDIDLRDRDITIKNKQIELDKLAVAKKRNERGFYIAGIVVLMISIVVIIKLQRTKIKRKEAEQTAKFGRQLLEIELKALRAQMNPHFIFNCLNSIQAFILKENRLEATNYLHKFSRLIRLILDSSQKTSNTIEDEAEILTLYLDLEKLRLKNKFDFEVYVAPDIDSSFAEIPSMVIQPIVENSIWHGFSHSDERGLLRVEFAKVDNQLKCIVEDNGIGREQSAKLKEQSGKAHISKGMKLIEDRLKAWSLTKGLQCEFNIFDNIANGRGTRTEISILYPVYA